MMKHPATWIILALLALLLGALLPPLLVRNAVRSSAEAIADAVRAEDMTALERHIVPAQRGLANQLIGPLLPGHGSSLRNLRITGMDRQDNGDYLLRAILNFDDASWGRQVFEARMLMQHGPDGWQLSLSDCEARRFSIAGDEDWTKAVDWLNLAQP